MTSAGMFVSLTALLFVSCFRACCAQNLTKMYGGTLGEGNAAQFTINVDDSYSFYWNGEFFKSPNGWPTTTTYTLIPVNQCNYPNILAIIATGDRSVDDGAIFQVLYGSASYGSGSSAEIKVALATSVNNTQWYLDATSDPSVWASSSTQPACSMVAQETSVQTNDYTASGARWVWYGSCNALQYAQVFLKLVIPTICNCCN